MKSMAVVILFLASHAFATSVSALFTCNLGDNQTGRDLPATLTISQEYAQLYLYNSDNAPAFDIGDTLEANNLQGASAFHGFKTEAFQSTVLEVSIVPAKSVLGMQISGEKTLLSVCTPGFVQSSAMVDCSASATYDCQPYASPAQ